MADMALNQEFPPKVPVQPADAVPVKDNLLQWVSLRLTVTDQDCVNDLSEKTEGRQRDEYALTALRIGILALKHARGQIDADAVKREGEKILTELKGALDRYRDETHQNLTGALREYFDPQSGRFQERVERLIKQDGDLEQALRRQVGIDGSELAKTLSSHIGLNSPLMKLLDPEQSAGLVSSIRGAVSGLVESQQSRILGEFSLDNEQGALKRLLGELTTANGRLRTDLADDLSSVIQEFSLDREDSALSRLVKRVEVAEETITKEFSLDIEGSALSRLSSVVDGAKQAIDANLTLDKEDSALSRLKRELVAILDEHQRKSQDFQTNVQSALEAMKAQRKEAARSTQHGNTFEASACEFIEQECKKTGDIADRTGTTTGMIKNCKVGDMVIELGPDCAAAGEKVVVEAKEDASYTLAKAREEIDTARKNRGASVGVFVFSAKTAPVGLDALVRHGNDVFLVWDADQLESDVILRAGLSVGKALCVRQRKQQDTEKGSWDELDRAILAIEKEISRVGAIRTMTETIQSHSGKILDELRKMASTLEKQIGEMRDSVAQLGVVSENGK